MRLALILLVVSFGWASCLADEPLSPVARYKAAIETMRDVPTPPFIRYRTSIPKGDSSIAFVLLADGTIRQDIQIGSPPYAAASWEVAYRGADNDASIALPSGGGAITTLALFDPTWHGAYRWLRNGLAASAQPPRPAMSRTRPIAAPPDDESVIAVVAAFNGGPYRIEDAGPDRCAHRPGHRLDLVPLHDPDAHPLRRVVIDDTDDRVCTVRFALDGVDGDAAYHGYVDLHFAEVGSYYLITDGFIDVRIDQNGVAMDWARFPFRFSDVSFPSSLPDALFTLPNS